MRCRITSILLRLTKGLRKEDGAATLEFVLILPALLMVFMASFESGLLMTRSIMLEQSVDMTMRELRLGHYTLPDSDLLKTEICRRTVIFKDCEQNITIEMRRVSTSTWSLPTAPIACIDRSEVIQPVTTLQIGQKNDIMIVRVCVVQDALFPSTGIGMKLPKDGHGGYGVISETAFVTEPI